MVVDKGTIRVYCTNGLLPLANVMVSLSDSKGIVVCKQHSNQFGYADLKYEKLGEYHLKAVSNIDGPIKTQNRWLTVYDYKRYFCIFVYSQNKGEKQKDFNFPNIKLDIDKFS